MLPRAIGGLTGGIACAPAELVYPTRIHASNRGAVERSTHCCLLVLAGAISLPVRSNYAIPSFHDLPSAGDSTGGRISTVKWIPAHHLGELLALPPPRGSCNRPLGDWSFHLGRRARHRIRGPRSGERNVRSFRTVLRPQLRVCSTGAVERRRPHPARCWFTCLGATTTSAAGRQARPGGSPSIAAPCRRCLSNEVEADTEIERPRRAHPAAVDADLAVAQVVAARADTGIQRVRRFRRTLSSCITSDRRVCCAAVGRAVHEAGRVSAFAAGGDAGAADHRATTLWEVRTNPPAVEAVLVDWCARAIPRARFVGSTQRWAAAGGRHGDWSQTTGPGRPPDPGCSAGGAAASRSGRNRWGQPFPATAEGSHAHNEQ